MMYPTPKQLARAPTAKFPESTLRTMALWKKEWYKGWVTKTKEDQLKGIVTMILTLAINEGHDKPKIVQGSMYGYSKIQNSIHIDKSNPSIISALHELAHFFFGESEVTACLWSGQLFKACFPKSYEKLQFDGHKLVKK